MQTLVYILFTCILIFYMLDTHMYMFFVQVNGLSPLTVTKANDHPLNTANKLNQSAAGYELWTRSQLAWGKVGRHPGPLSERWTDSSLPLRNLTVSKTKTNSKDVFFFIC